MFDFDWLIKTGPCKKYIETQLIPFFNPDNPTEKAMYILISGGVEITENGKQVAKIEKGGVFGGAEFFGEIGDCACVASVDSIVYVITESSFVQLSKTRPDVLFELLRAAYSDSGRPAASGKAAAAPVKEAAEPAKEAVAPVKEAVALDIEEGSIFPPGHKSYPGITKPEHAKLVFPKEYTCPLCKKKFNDFRVMRSKLYQSGPIRFDLRKSYTDFQAEWYDVVTCSHCYFSVHYTYFADSKPLLKNAVESNLAVARQNIIMDFDGERDINFVFTSHYLAILCSAGYVPTGRQLRAKMWGNISWLYEDVQDEEMAKFAAAKTAEAYEEVYMSSTLTPVQEQVTCLSIAGMLYRAGREDNLKKYLFTAKTIKGGDRAYTKMAEDMMDMLREGE